MSSWHIDVTVKCVCLLERMKLFVGSLSWNTTGESLHAAFAAFGEVTEAKVIMDRDTGRTRGFGFVTMEGDGAQNAMDSLNGAGRW